MGVAVLASQFLVALPIRKKMAHSAIPCAAMDTTVLAQFVGRTALMSLEMMAPSVTNQSLMDVELAQPTSVTTVKSMDSFGIQSAARTSTMSAAVSALLTAPQV